MSHPAPQTQSALKAATAVCRRMIRSLLDRAAARNRPLKLIFLAAMTVLLMVTLAFGLGMSK